MPKAASALALVWALSSHGHGWNGSVHVGCEESGRECARALQTAIDAVPAGTTITLDPGKVYDGTIVIRPKEGASGEARLTITTRGWAGNGEAWDGLVTPDDKPRLAAIRGTRGEPVALDVRAGEGAGHVVLRGLAFEATPPSGQGDLIRIGSSELDEPAQMPRHVSIRQVLLQGSREFGQKRGIAANGQDIAIEQVWCEEIFTVGQDSQCVAAWNGGVRVTVRHSYLAAASENVLVGGAPIRSAAMQPADWIVEDVVLHKPLRWKEDGRNRQVKNLLEFKHGRNLTARRVLAVNTWRAAQDGRGLLINYTTNGACPACGNLENVLVEDLVMLNVEHGVSFQGYSWQRDSRSGGHLSGVTLRHVYMALSAPGRLFLISNIRGRHDIRIERSTFVNHGTGWLVGSFGRAWRDAETHVEGGAMQGLWITDNVIAMNGEYGVTAPDSHHFGRGLGAFVDGDLQIAGNVIGDAPDAHLREYNRHRAGGALNAAAPRSRVLAALPADACGEWAPGVGASCARLRPVFALTRVLPEP